MRKIFSINRLMVLTSTCLICLPSQFVAAHDKSQYVDISYGASYSNVFPVADYWGIFYYQVLSGEGEVRADIGLGGFFFNEKYTSFDYVLAPSEPTDSFTEIAELNYNRFLVPLSVRLTLRASLFDIGINNNFLESGIRTHSVIEDFGVLIRPSYTYNILKSKIKNPDTDAVIEQNSYGNGWNLETGLYLQLDNGFSIAVSALYGKTLLKDEDAEEVFRLPLEKRIESSGMSYLATFGVWW
ncbi:MAG: hypothetical protein ACRBF0_11625 [Calditrichia bacterium]